MEYIVDKYYKRNLISCTSLSTSEQALDFIDQQIQTLKIRFRDNPNALENFSFRIEICTFETL